MRAHTVIKGLGETSNAAELKALAVQQWGRAVVDEAVAKIQGGG